jgi:AcrR family transcriptional regulator
MKGIGTRMKTVTAKLSGEERRAAIINAVRRVFAERGFHGTTTRELAEAADVSEALLFKHFPNKEALYSAMQMSCCHTQDPAIERLKALEPSTSTLVVMVHFLLTRKIGASTVEDEDHGIQMRLMMRSVMEDGEFARLQLKQFAQGFVAKIEECIRAAVAAGDAKEGPVASELAAWFVHHLAVALMQNLRTATPVVDYKVSRPKLVEQAVWFALRGMGLKDEAIQRYYNPKALALIAG